MAQAFLTCLKYPNSLFFIFETLPSFTSNILINAFLLLFNKLMTDFEFTPVISL